MSRNKKTAASSANTGSSIDGNVTSQGAASISDYTSNSFVSQWLQRGAENAIRSEVLVKLCGFKSVRELRAAVERERNSGRVILTCQGGYFLPSVDEEGRITKKGYCETEDFYRKQSSKGRSCLSSARSAKKILAEYRRMGELNG